MEISVQTIISTATLVGSIAVSWGISKNQNEEVRRKVESMEKWKEAHEKESNDVRLGLQKDIGRIDTSQAVHAEQYRTIIATLDEIKTDLAKLRK